MPLVVSKILFSFGGKFSFSFQSTSNDKCLCCRVLEQLGGKQWVMQHLTHPDPSVRYEALLAVQKLMVHNWYVCQTLCLITSLYNFYHVLQSKSKKIID